MHLKKKIQRSFKILLGYLRISDSAIEHRANKKKKKNLRNAMLQGVYHLSTHSQDATR